MSASCTTARRAASRAASVMAWCRFQARANSSIPTDQKENDRQDQGELDQGLTRVAAPAER